MDGWIWLLSLDGEFAWTKTHRKTELEGWLAKQGGGSAVEQRWFHGRPPSTAYPLNMRFADASVQTTSMPVVSDVMVHLTKGLADLREDLLKAVTQRHDADVQAVEQRMVERLQAESKFFEQCQSIHFTTVKDQFDHLEAMLHLDNQHREETYHFHEAAIESKLEEMERRHENSVDLLTEVHEKATAQVAERISTSEQTTDELKNQVDAVVADMTNLTSNLKGHIIQTIMELLASRRKVQLENQAFCIEDESEPNYGIAEEENMDREDESEPKSSIVEEEDMGGEDEREPNSGIAEKEKVGGEDEKEKFVHDHKKRSRSPPLRRRAHLVGWKLDVANTSVDDSWDDDQEDKKTPPWRTKCYRAWTSRLTSGGFG